MSEASDRDEAMTYAAKDRYIDIPAVYRRKWTFGPWSGHVTRTITFRIHERSLSELIALEHGIALAREKYPGAMEYVMVSMLLVGAEARFQTLETLTSIIDAHYALNYPKVTAEAKRIREANRSPSAPSSDGSAPIPSSSPGTPLSN